MLTRTKWDWRTSIEEVMNGLHYLVASGKVRYLVSLFAEWTPPASPNPPLASQLHQGISDTPAWIVTKANRKDAVLHLPRRLEHSPVGL